MKIIENKDGELVTYYTIADLCLAIKHPYPKVYHVIKRSGLKFPNTTLRGCKKKYYTGDQYNDMREKLTIIMGEGKMIV